MSVLPASATLEAGAGERSELSTALAPFPWLEDTTRHNHHPARARWVPPLLSLGAHDSLTHDVLVIFKPSVGKAVAVYRPVLSPLQQLREQKCRSVVDPSTGKLVDPLTGEFLRPTAWDQLSAAEQLEHSAARANGRAASTMTDYMVHNRLTKMWVLTFKDEGLHGVEGRKEAMRRTAAFVRRMRRDFFKGKPFPYVYSPELHPSGHGWHVNLFVPNVFMHKGSLQRSWTHGNVWFTDFERDKVVKHSGRRIGAVKAGRSTGGTTRAARKAASYASKYASKDWATDEIGHGAHRYERAEGFPVPEQRMRVRTFEDFAALVRAHPACGQVYTEWAMDSDTDGWCGPPMRGLLFDHGSSPRSSRVKEERRKSSLPISENSLMRREPDT